VHFVLQWLAAMFGHWQSWLSGGGAGGAVLIILLLVEKFHPKGWTMPKRWYAVLVAMFFVLGSSFYTWKDELDRATQMQGERDQKQRELDDLQQPKFKMIFEQINTGHFNRDLGSSFVMFRLAVTNSGAPSLVRLKGCDLQFPDGKKVKAKPILNPTQGLRANSVEGNKNISLDAPMSEFFEVKAAAQPVPRGGELAGWVNYDFPLPYADMDKAGNKFIVHFADVNDKPYDGIYEVQPRSLDEFPFYTPPPPKKP
jgi:hypothetical protein